MKRLEARFTQMIPWNQYWSSFDFILKKQLLCFHDKYFLNFITGEDNQKKRSEKRLLSEFIILTAMLKLITC